MSDISFGDSAIQGLGVFARRAFAAGDVIAVLDTSRVVDDAHPLRADLGERLDHTTGLANGRVVLLPPPARYLNHSCDPNAYLRTVGDELRLVARRRISPSDEVTLDYLINTDGGDRWRCDCGAPGCRGVLESSFFDLPGDVRLRYLPLLDCWFIEAHAERLAAIAAEAEASEPTLWLDWLLACARGLSGEQECEVIPSDRVSVRSRDRRLTPRAVIRIRDRYFVDAATDPGNWWLGERSAGGEIMVWGQYGHYTNAFRSH